MKKDLDSANYLVVAASLTALSKLLTKETIPTVLSIIMKFLDHPKFFYLIISF